MRLILFAVLSFAAQMILSCGPSGAQHSVRRRNPAKRITPFVRYQRHPNVAELTLGASGPTEKAIVKGSRRFKQLVVYSNNNVVFKKWKRKQMSKRCKDKLSALSIMVLNEWQGVKLRVIEGYANKKNLKLHSPNSLHYEGRALDITTDDRDLKKYGRLARLAEEAGFDWVYYQSRRHVHVSVKSDRAVTTQTHGCFSADSEVKMADGTAKKVHELSIGDSVMGAKSAQFSEVIGWLHRDPSLRMQFVQLTFNTNASLTLTGSHLLFSEGRSIFARDVIPGQIIDSTNGDDGVVIVTDKRLISKRGVYAPLTHQGTISVQNIACSCYALVNSHRVAHIVLSPVRMIHSFRRWLHYEADPIASYANLMLTVSRPFLPKSLFL